MIETARLKLIPATAESVRAEIGDHGELARILAATVPENWPPETLADALPLFLEWMEAAPGAAGWFGWYALADHVLIGGGGFLGEPQDGTARIGYSVLPQFQNRGYATELVRALVRWALAQPGVTRIAAETEWANPASVRVLTKLGFAPAGAAADPGGARFEFTGRSPAAAEPRRGGGL